MQYVIIILALLIVNGILFWAVRQNGTSMTNQINQIRDKYISTGEHFEEDELEDEVEPEQKFTWIIGIAICLDIWIIGAVITHLWAYFYFNGKTEGINAKALFGDSFGAVNALISAFAFAGMIVAFVLQRYELKLQRKELKAQRKEFEQQNETLALQRFENTFFNMMELQQQIVNDLSIKDYDKVWTKEDGEHGMMGRENLIASSRTGRQFISYIYYHSIEGKQPGTRQRVGLGPELLKGGLSAYENSSYRSLLDHYFRHLYTILKFINESQDIPRFKDKYKYTSFLRATLSRDELVLLYYNGLSSVGNQKLKPLIEKYCMLKNLDKEMLILNHDSFELTKAGDPKEAYKFLEENNLSGTDFEILLTDEQNDSTKYYITAFYNKEEDINKAKELVSKVRELLK